MSEDDEICASRRDVLLGGALGMGALVGAIGLAGVPPADAATPGAAAPAASAAAASPNQTFWLQVPGVDGPGTTKGFEKQIPLLAFSWGVAGSDAVGAGSGSGSGSGAGKVALQPFVIRKHIDKASPVLFLQCASGKHLRNVTLRGTRASGDGRRATYLTIVLDDVLVSSVQQSDAAPGVPGEILHLTYGKVTYTVDGRTVSIDAAP